METKFIVLLVLLALQLAATVFSVVWLIKYRESYPVKQLSPRVTILISASLWLASGLLTIYEICYDERLLTDGNIFTCNQFYAFFREVAVLGFYLRCMRICVAYYKQLDCRLIMAIFRSEVFICLLVCGFSLLLPIVQIFQKYVADNKPSELFIFDLKAGGNPFSYVLWGIDNGLFFVVVFLSARVAPKFKFVGTLVAAFIFVHI